jgi:hypothetical protein
VKIGRGPHHGAAVQADERINLELELVPGTPVTGRLVGEASESAFIGWTEMVASVKRALDERVPPVEERDDK